MLTTTEGNNSLDGAEVFAAGEHRGKTYTIADLDDMVRNFQLFCLGQKPGYRVPLVVGDDTQEFLNRTDLPAAGWCTRLWRDGRILKANFEDVPEKIALLIRAKRFRTVSSEVYDGGMPEGIPHRGKMLRRVAMLGGDFPDAFSCFAEDPALTEVAAHFDKFSDDYRRAGYSRDKFIKDFVNLNDTNKLVMLVEYRKLASKLGGKL